MSIGQEATLDVEWVEMVYNTSEGGAGLEKRRKKKARVCEVVCSVDAETAAGTPVVVAGGMKIMVGSGWVLCSALLLGAYMAL